MKYAAHLDHRGTLLRLKVKPLLHQTWIRVSVKTNERYFCYKKSSKWKWKIILSAEKRIVTSISQSQHQQSIFKSVPFGWVAPAIFKYQQKQVRIFHLLVLVLQLSGKWLGQPGRNVVFWKPDRVLGGEEEVAVVTQQELTLNFSCWHHWWAIPYCFFPLSYRPYLVYRVIRRKKGLTPPTTPHPPRLQEVISLLICRQNFEVGEVNYSKTYSLWRERSVDSKPLSRTNRQRSETHMLPSAEAHRSFENRNLESAPEFETLVAEATTLREKEMVAHGTSLLKHVLAL